MRRRNGIERRKEKSKAEERGRGKERKRVKYTGCGATCLEGGKMIEWLRGKEGWRDTQ